MTLFYTTRNFSNIFHTRTYLRVIAKECNVRIRHVVAIACPVQHSLVEVMPKLLSTSSVIRQPHLKTSTKMSYFKGCCIDICVYLLPKAFGKTGLYCCNRFFTLCGFAAICQKMGKIAGIKSGATNIPDVIKLGNDESLFAQVYPIGSGT